RGSLAVALPREPLMHGVPVVDELTGGPAAELPHAPPAGSPPVVPCHRQRDREPEPGVLVVLQQAGEHAGRAAREPGLHQGGGGVRALVGVVRLQAASVRANLTAAQSSEHAAPVSSPRRRDPGISRRPRSPCALVSRRPRRSGPTWGGGSRTR